MHSSLYRSIAVAVTIIVFSPSVHAAPIISGFIANSGDDSTDWMVPGFDTEIGFVAEGRIGGAGTFELKVAPDTSTSYPASEAEYSWASGDWTDFTLDFNGTDATWTLGDEDVRYTFSSGFSNFDSLVIRAATPGANTSVVFDSLVLNGNSLGGFDNTWNPDTQNPTSRQVSWLTVANAGDLASGFTLSGNVALSWEGTPPTQSNLAFQIKGASGPVLSSPGPNSVPEPATVVLLGVGAMGLALAAYRRQRVVIAARVLE